MQKRLRAFCFTLNNYTEEQFQALKKELPAVSRYCIVGKEKGEEKETEHLQGYVSLSKQWSFSTLQLWFQHNIRDAKPHIEAAKGSPAQNRLYCSKEGNFWEEGEVPKQGKRNDILAFKEAIKNGATDLQLLEEHTSCFFSCANKIAQVRQIYSNEEEHKRLVEEMKDAVLRPWQTQIVELVAAQDRRKVLWVFDEVGNVGKSFLADWFCAKGPVFLVDGGKKIDCAHAYNKQPLVIFDFPRNYKDLVQYNLIESFKNGIIFSGKYNSHVKRFKPAKVVVFANFPPKISELSKDRWQVFDFQNRSRKETEVQEERKEETVPSVTTCSHNNCNETNCFCQCHFN